MKSKHFMHWFFRGENEQIDRNESSWERYKNSFFNCSNYECEWKGPLRTKKQCIQWLQRDDICYTCVQSIVPTDSFEVSSTFASTCSSFIHSFIYLHFFWFPYQLWRFFVFPSISNTMNVNKPLSIFGIIHGSSAPDQQFEKRKRMLMEK